MRYTTGQAGHLGTMRVMLAGFVVGGSLAAVVPVLAQPRIIVPVANPVATPSLPTTVTGLAARPGFGRFDGANGAPIVPMGGQGGEYMGAAGSSSGYANYGGDERRHDHWRGSGHSSGHGTGNHGGSGHGSGYGHGLGYGHGSGYGPGGHGGWYDGNDIYFSDPSAGLVVRLNFHGLTTWPWGNQSWYWRTGYNWAPPYRIDQQPSVYVPVAMSWQPEGQGDRVSGALEPSPPPPSVPTIDLARGAMRAGDFAQAVDFYRAELAARATTQTSVLPGLPTQLPPEVRADAFGDAITVDPTADAATPEDGAVDQTLDEALVWRELALALLADGRVSDAVSVLIYTLEEMPDSFAVPLDGASLGLHAGRLGSLGQRASQWGQASGQGGGLLLAVEMERATPRPRSAQIVRLLRQASSLGTERTPLHSQFDPVR